MKSENRVGEVDAAQELTFEEDLEMAPGEKNKEATKPKKVASAKPQKAAAAAKATEKENMDTSDVADKVRMSNKYPV